VRIVRFIKRAQELGFALDEAEQLLRLRRVTASRRPSVRALATAKLADINTKVEQLAAMRVALETMLSACCGDGVHDAVVGRDEGRARIVFDPTRTSPESIALAISQAGFQAGVLP
jgi:hypothetical protein